MLIIFVLIHTKHQIHSFFRKNSYPEAICSFYFQIFIAG